MSILLKTLIKSGHWDTKVDIENRKVDIQGKKKWTLNSIWCWKMKM